MQTDVVIAGGGPAGSACALTLARAGFEVTIVEQAAFPRRKTCGEYLNAGAVRLLDELGVLAAVRTRAQPLERLVMRNRAGTSVTLPFGGESLSFPRADLDALLADAAQNAGVRRVRGRAVTLLSDDAARTSGLRYRDGDAQPTDVAAKFVVGADGAQSSLAAAAGLRRPGVAARRYAVGGHYDGLQPSAGLLDMIVDGSAYLALNPLGEGCSNVMLVLPADRIAAGDGADAFVKTQMAAIGGPTFAAARRIGPRVGFGPLESFVRGAAAPGLALVGDAAGMIDPFTGQGVFLALRSGINAGRAIAAVLAGRSDEAVALGAYAREHGRDLTLRRRACALVKLIVANPALARFAAARVAGTPERAAPLLAAISGIGRIESAFAPSTLLGLVA
jgi:flavin-dependent dehydrogenase